MKDNDRSASERDFAALIGEKCEQLATQVRRSVELGNRRTVVRAEQYVNGRKYVLSLEGPPEDAGPLATMALRTLERHINNVEEEKARG